MYVSNNIYNKYVSNKRNLYSFDKHVPSVSDVRIIILEKMKTKDENPKNKQPNLGQRIAIKAQGRCMSL